MSPHLSILSLLFILVTACAEPLTLLDGSESPGSDGVALDDSDESAESGSGDQPAQRRTDEVVPQVDEGGEGALDCQRHPEQQGCVAGEPPPEQSRDDGTVDSAEEEEEEEVGSPEPVDPDSDGDGLTDAVEGDGDSDLDGIPDYLDEDTDNDTITDRIEGHRDTDGDGLADRYDLDSDDDGYSDQEEAGDTDLGTRPVDTDGDSIADFRDLDSDADALFDALELGCSHGSTERGEWDSDGDGHDDLMELTVGSSPCDGASVPDAFFDVFFRLPPDVSERAELGFETDVLRADIHFNIDTTGSMRMGIESIQTQIATEIIPDLQALLPDPAFSVSSFRSFPVGEHGTPVDYPFRLEQDVTTDVVLVRSAVEALRAAEPGVQDESGYEALYQIAAGGGVSWDGGAISPFGGVSFREDSLPIVVHITDDHPYNAGRFSDEVHSPHTKGEAIVALEEIGARVVGVALDSNARNHLRELATLTNARVPACVFDGACAGRCCTGLNGSGEGSASGLCPLSFMADLDGTGLSQSIADAIYYALRYASIEVSTRVLDDPDDPVDTTCFVQSVTAGRYENEALCYGAAYPNGEEFVGVTPGTRLFFDIDAENNGCVEPTDQVQSFTATIEVIGNDVALLDRRNVTFIVPPVQPEIKR